jgi:excisionase family DNA binding protein
MGEAMPTTEEFITTAEAARRLGMTACGVRVAIRRGDIPATPFGRSWMVSAAAVDNWEPRHIGPPFSDKERCPCCANTLTRARTRGFECCRALGVDVSALQQTEKPQRKQRKRKKRPQYRDLLDRALELTK